MFVILIPAIMVALVMKKQKDSLVIALSITWDHCANMSAPAWEIPVRMVGHALKEEL